MGILHKRRLYSSNHVLCIRESKEHEEGGNSKVRQAGKQVGRQAGRQAGGQAGRQAGRRAGRRAGRQAGCEVVILTSCFSSDPANLCTSVVRREEPLRTLLRAARLEWTAWTSRTAL